MGFVSKRIRPILRGINLITREFIPPNEILLIASNYISTDDYYQVIPKGGYCRFYGTKRRLLMQFNDKVFDIEYPQPFINLDWSVFNSEDIAVETIPEFIRDGNLKIQLERL